MIENERINKLKKRCSRELNRLVDNMAPLHAQRGLIDKYQFIVMLAEIDEKEKNPSRFWVISTKKQLDELNKGMDILVDTREDAIYWATRIAEGNSTSLYLFENEEIIGIINCGCSLYPKKVFPIEEIIEKRECLMASKL